MAKSPNKLQQGFQMKTQARVDFKEGHVTGTNRIHWPSELSIHI